MKGKTVNAHTFMSRTANHSTKGSRRGFVDVETGVDPSKGLSLEQQRQNLINHQKALIRERSNCVGAEHARLGLLILECQNRLTELNAKRSKHNNSMYYFFHRAAALLLPVSEVDRLWNTARTLAKQDAEQQKEPQP